MTARRRFRLVDVFAEGPFTGNPLAVFPEAGGLDAESMRRIASEMGHAATAFLFPPASKEAEFLLRIFSREREIPFAGYPALGAHFVRALESGRTLEEPVTRAKHETPSGTFEVEMRVEKGAIVLLRLPQRPPELSPRLNAEEIAAVAEALSLEEKDIEAANQPVRVVSTGLPALLVPVATLKTLESARPRFNLLRRVLEGREATLVYAFTKETVDPRAAAQARAFDVLTASEIPGAGAAAGALAAYLVSHSAVTVLPTTSLTIEQGHFLRRPSRLFLEVHVRDRKVARVILGGRVVAVGEGWLGSGL
ncbi:MAG TPA: PhzF family phenazine biosynthesis protein [Thermoanaerobaculia bacterium]